MFWKLPNMRQAHVCLLRMRAGGQVSWRHSASTAVQGRVADEIHDHKKVHMLMCLFRERGHLLAQLDPLKRVHFGPWLGHNRSGTESETFLESLLKGYDLGWGPEQKCQFLTSILRLRIPATPTRLFGAESIYTTSLVSSPDVAERMEAPVHELMDIMHRSYCGTLAFQFMHLLSRSQQQWLTAKAEERWQLDVAAKHTILKHLLQADLFERFFAEKFPASKRFGLEGCEALIPGLHVGLERLAGHGVQRIEMGMAHRGRLNVLHNLLDKSLGALCSEMEGHQSEFHVGDVKYHLGQTSDKELGGGKQLHLSIAPNPSHLEMINPVVLGLVRALQAIPSRKHGDREVMALLIHGDASISGLGIVAESFQMSALPGYSTGGSIHVVINNQIGFTTVPEDSRSSMHCSDVATMVGAAVLHANADDPEAVVRAFQIAADWRATFQSDVVVNLCGYRRNGHNELDMPMTTLPTMYAQIAQHPTVLEIYSRKLIADGHITAETIEQWKAELLSHYRKEYQLAMDGAYKEKALTFLESHWQKDALASITERTKMGPYPRQEATGLPIATLQMTAQRLCRTPPGMQLHPQVAALLERRKKMAHSLESRVDFSFAELLAFGTLSLRRAAVETAIQEEDPDRAHFGGLNISHFNVRLTGQDTERGTFNQRHAVVYDQVTGERVVAISHIAEGSQDDIDVYNSPLNEAASLAFEYGYSVAAKSRSLVLWEAQFGDFANNAQVIIDQFVASGGYKWGQQSGLVMLLPHGYDGQGPDHSSARMERFLQLMNDDADHLPGYSPKHRKQISDMFEAVAAEFGSNQLQRNDVEAIMNRLGLIDTTGDTSTEIMDVLWSEMGLGSNGSLDAAAWEAFMVSFIRRQAERDANMSVVMPSTPAQYFHVLRRQANLPYQRPLIVFTPKLLHHHRPATSALQDFSVGTFFNRVIDDGKSSDNTRHLAFDKSGRQYLRDDEEIARILLCCGQIYYQLSRARRSRKIDNIVLVRLEQIAPFPHDRVLQVIGQYPNAEVCWVQDEPKNQGAWNYVRPRLTAAMKHDVNKPLFHLFGRARLPTVRYIGRPTSASTATAAYWIHAKEQEDIIDESLTFDS